MLDATNSAGLGNYKNSKCLVETRKDTTLVVSNLQLFQSSLISLPTLAPEGIGQPDVLLLPRYYPMVMDLMIDELGGPGNTTNSICLFEAPRDIAPAIRGSQIFRTDRVTQVSPRKTTTTSALITRMSEVYGRRSTTFIL